MARVEFLWERTIQSPAVARRPAGIRLSDEVLLRNARWFVKLRWIVVAFLLFFQAIILLFGNHLSQIGIVVQGFWPAIIAGVLGLANIWYSLTGRKEGNAGLSLAVNIWTQVVVDLICLTFVVHFLGSLATPAPFLYAVHIVLAGVFLSTHASFVVLSIAGVFYVSCVVLEYAGMSFPHSILLATAQASINFDWWSILLQVVSLNFLFLVVWYMVAQLSQIIRTRENQLIEAGEQTRLAQKEKDRYAVQMTHQLKSPLDAIRSNISLLVNGYCGTLPEEASQVLKKIDFRAKGMGELIIDVLKLSRVKSAEDPQSMITVDISKVLKECVEELRAYAEKREVSIEADLDPVEKRCFLEQMKMFFENILTNAISYSYIGGTVRVRCKQGGGAQGALVEVSDQGIGIESDKLPHIFDAYFRTKEASEYNQSSSGIGLAIVKRVAQNHDLRIVVASEPKKGTTFGVYFPRQQIVSGAVPA